MKLNNIELPMKQIEALDILTTEKNAFFLGKKIP